jgi:regulator of replication initiation timing
MEVADAREENVALRAQVAELTQRLDVRQKLERRGNVYHLKDPPTGYSEGPYCMTCFDDDGKLISVHVYGGSRGSVMRCMRCLGRKR